MTAAKEKGTLSVFSRYVSLNILAMIGLSCYILADTFFISRGMGENGLTALNLVIPFYSLMNGIGLMLGVGGATKYAVYLAQGEQKQADQVFTHTVFLGACFGVFFFLVGQFFSDSICRALGSDAQTHQLAQTYLRTILSFAPMFQLNNIFVAFVRNDGDPRLSMAAMLSGSISNIVLDYIFIFPFQWGMFGAAFATGLAPVISLGVLSVRGFRGKNNFHLVRTKIRFGYFKTICLLGLSSLIGELSSGITVLVFNMVILDLQGNIGVAAYGVMANLALVGTALFTGIAQGIQPILSTGFGANDRTAVKKTLKYALILAVAISLVMYLLLFLFAGPVAEVFNKNHLSQLRALAQTGIRIYFVGFLFSGLNIVLAAFFSAVEVPAPSFLISILRGCVAIIPCVLLCAALFGMNGVWASYGVSELLTLLAACLLFFRFSKTSRFWNA